MSRQNRVTPWGEIIATTARGTLMGNRGCLHDDKGRIVRQWARMPWVTCLLEFKGRHRSIMAPGKYTELFFLDEATALAAGHRPCATCRRSDYDEFKALWLSANPDLALATGLAMAEIDRVLHGERVDPEGRKRTWIARLGELPDGVMVAREGGSDPLLVLMGSAYPWAARGYGVPQRLAPKAMVRVLTPPSFVRVLSAGYRPSVQGLA